MDLIYSNIDKIVNISVLITGSLFLRFLLEIAGQSWIKTVAHTATITLLPIITYVITSVISGNIALSLGMVGALSIVRFRNPVRSPLELSVYFGAITMGITASVGMNWLLLLLASALIVALTLYLVNFFLRFLNISFFITSFSEGIQLSTLELETKGKMALLEDHPFLMLKNQSDGRVSYNLSSNNFEKLRLLENQISEMEDVISSRLSR
jgi:hypothetical protein